VPDANPPIPPTVPPGGVRPPDAGVSGTASFRAPARCITRASALRLTARDIARLSVTVDGRRVSRQALRLLQSSPTPLSRLTRPGRHRVSIRVEFRTGSDTAAVTLTRTVVVCAPPVRVPRLTG